LLGPGLNFPGLDVCGICIGLRSISTRVMQNQCAVTTTTKDHIFVTIKLAVQQTPDPENLDVAIYKLADVDTQMDSMVSNMVRAKVPEWSLDELFENQHRLTGYVQEALSAEMAEFGFHVTGVLIADIIPDREVSKSMNQVYQQKMLREATIAQAESENIKLVKAAEARADAAHLQGQGSARCSGAIIDGLRSALVANQESAAQVPNDKVLELYLMSQSFELLKQVAARKTSEVVFLNGGLGQ